MNVLKTNNIEMNDKLLEYCKMKDNIKNISKSNDVYKNENEKLILKIQSQKEYLENSANWLYKNILII